MSDNLYFLWLSLACHSTVGNRLLQVFGNPYDIYRADGDTILKALDGCRTAPASVSRLCEKDLTAAQTLMDYCFLHRIGLLTLGSPQYPASLRQIETPPIVLYYRGTLPAFDHGLMISVVGTRRMTEYGEKAAFTISYDLARTGVTIVSGLARGIDGVAAAAAVAAGGKTIAVLGSGLDRIYPKEHKYLANEISRNGLLLSEYPPSAPPLRHHFPERNRIIAGLSAGTLLTEGGEQSGALITAKLAEAEGKRIFAVPGNIDSEQSFAPNYLIRNGAKAVTCADDILDSYKKLSLRGIRPFALLRRDNINRRAVLHSLKVASDAPETAFHRPDKDELLFCPEEAHGGAVAVAAAAPMRQDSATDREPALSGEQKTIFHTLSRKIPKTVDEIAAESGVGAPKALAVLLLLEVEGHVVSLPGGRYRRT